MTHMDSARTVLGSWEKSGRQASNTDLMPRQNLVGFTEQTKGTITCLREIKHIPKKQHAKDYKATVGYEKQSTG